MRRFGRWMFNALAVLSLVLCVATAGCDLEAQFQLSRSSRIPEQWKNDPRTKGWTGFNIEYYCYTDGEVIAHIGPRPRHWYYYLLGWEPGCFTVRGDNGPEPHVVNPMPGVRYGYFRFNGTTERYEFQYPDPDPRVIGVTLRLLRKDEHTGILPPSK